MARLRHLPRPGLEPGHPGLPLRTPLTIRRLAGSVVLALLLGACGAVGDVAELGSGTPSPAPTGADEAGTSVPVVPATVVRVIDGDTAEMRMPDGSVEDVRFIGVDTPESTTRHEPYGSEAAAYTTQRLEDRQVYLQIGIEERDRYGRLLAYVWLSRPVTGDPAEVRQSMFNAHLLRDGYAQLLTIPPNVDHVEVFRALQTEAREASRGLWGLEP